MGIPQLLLVLAILAGLGGFIMQHDKRVVAEASVETAKKSAAVLQEVVDNADNLSKVRAREIAELKAKNSQMATQLAKLTGPARLWLDAPVPDDVRRLRRDAYGGVGLVLHPDQGTAANPGAAVERRDGGSTGAGSERQPGRTDSVQQGQSGRAEVTVTPEQTTSILKRIRALRGEK